MYNGKEDTSIDEKMWTHDWMIVCMIIAIIHCDLCIILKSQPGWMKLDIGSSISFTQPIKVRV